MTFDMNDAEPQKTGDLIPDGTFAKVTMTLRPGGIDGESEIDRGLLKRSATEGSDVLMLDAEFTVTEGPHIRRKFWQTLTVSGGKLDENGVSIGARITKSTLRAMIDSALGLDPEDMSEATKAKRILRGFADLSGITFVAKIKVEASDNPAYPDKNRLDHVVRADRARVAEDHGRGDRAGPAEHAAAAGGHDGSGRRRTGVGIAGEGAERGDRPGARAPPPAKPAEAPKPAAGVDPCLAEQLRPAPARGRDRCPAGGGSRDRRSPTRRRRRRRPAVRPLPTSRGASPAPSAAARPAASATSTSCSGAAIRTTASARRAASTAAPGMPPGTWE